MIRQGLYSQFPQRAWVRMPNGATVEVVIDGMFPVAAEVMSRKPIVPYRLAPLLRLHGRTAGGPVERVTIV